MYEVLLDISHRSATRRRRTVRRLATAPAAAAGVQGDDDDDDDDDGEVEVHTGRTECCLTRHNSLRSAERTRRRPVAASYDRRQPTIHARAEDTVPPTGNRSC